MFEDGDDNFGDDFETYRPLPHPDDRLWRHPSEIAAEMAAQARAHAEAETRPLPIVDSEPASQVVDLSGPSVGRQLNRRVAAVIAVAAVGVAFVGVGAWWQSAPRAIDEAAIGAGGEIAERRSAEPAPVAIDPISGADLESFARAVTAAQPDLGGLELRLHQELAPALPAIQAASGDSMREGSGMIIDTNGHVVTSAGLVDGADYVLVWTADGRRWPADIIGSDPISDIALLTIEAEAALATATISIDGPIRTGQYALSIDHQADTMYIGEVLSPLGQSQVGRGDPADRIVISPGALPGAAILDHTGDVVGVANHSPGDTVYATPSIALPRIVTDLTGTGLVEHPWIGIQVDPIENTAAVVVTEVVQDSPAAQAGIRTGDVVNAIDRVGIGASESIWSLVGRHRPGEPVDFGLTRNGFDRTITVTTGSHLDAPG